MDFIEQLNNKARRRNLRHTAKSHREGYGLTAVLDDTEVMTKLFKHAVCSYTGHRETSEMLRDILDNYDRYHEDFNAASWLNTAEDAAISECLMDIGCETLGAVEKIMSSIAERAERQCKLMLRAVLSASDTQQMKILGLCLSMNDEEIDEFIEYFFETTDIVYSPNADESYDIFITSVLDELEDVYI